MIPNQSHPRVTVVMITRDRREELLHTLEHMTALPDSAPIVLVDNASADGTAEAVRERFPAVHLVISDENLGSLGRNLAVDYGVNTPYIAFCDDDTRWQPGALTRAADLLDQHSELATVTGRILVEPDLAEDPITAELRDSPVPGPDWLPGPALLGILAGATMVRADVLRAVGGFSERIWFGGEEELLAIDIAAAGWWMCWAEDVVVHHAPSLTRDPSRRRALGIRNTLWVTWLRRPAFSAIRRTAALVGSFPRDLTTFRALAEAAGGLPWVVRERQVVPASVEAGLRLLEEPQRRSTARSYIG
jgi:GT2 family glycosyltransferase